MTTMRRGTVTRLESDKGFGFLRDEFGQPWFFVTAALADPAIVRETTVTFDEESTPLGPRAANIRRVSS
jgi:cold shock CspA family protein